MIKILTVTVILTGILLFLECLERIKKYVTPIYNGISSWFADKKYKDSAAEEIVEKSSEDDFYTGRYDIYAFRERMQKLKDENGLYDIPEEPEITDFTGVEIAEEK